MRSIQFVSLVLVSLLPAIAGQNPPESVQVEGSVLNALSGAPIRRARVNYQPFSPAGGTMAPTETEQGKIANCLFLLRNDVISCARQLDGNS